MTLRYGVFLIAASLFAQGRGPVNREARNKTEQELESIAIIERKLMVPMRDGKRMATDVYRPKDPSKKYPIIFVRTPYNFNFWDVRNGAPRDMTAEITAIKHGYAYVEMNERGHFFSEGIYDILGPPLTDGSDAISWMAKQPTRSPTGRTPSRGWRSSRGRTEKSALSGARRRRNGSWRWRRRGIRRSPR